MNEKNRPHVHLILARGFARLREMLARVEERARLVAILEELVADSSALDWHDLKQLESAIDEFRKKRIEELPAIYLSQPADDEDRPGGLLRCLNQDEHDIAEALLAQCCAGDRDWAGVLNESEVAELRAIERSEPRKK